MASEISLQERERLYRLVKELDQKAEWLTAKYLERLKGLHLLTGQEYTKRQNELSEIADERAAVIRQAAELRLQATTFGKTFVKGENKKPKQYRTQRKHGSGDVTNPLR